MPHALENRFWLVLWNSDIPLGIYWKSTGFRSLFDHCKCPEMSSLSGSLWMTPKRKKQQPLTWGWGMNQAFSEWNVIFSTFWNSRCSRKLIKDIQASWDGNQGWKAHRCAALPCSFWPELQSILFSKSWPHPQGNTKINTLPLKSWTSKKVSCWAAGWKSNIGRWNSLSILQTTVTRVFFLHHLIAPVSFWYRLIASLSVIQILQGLVPPPSKGNTNRKGGLGKPKEIAGKDCDFQKERHAHHQHLRLVS